MKTIKILKCRIYKLFIKEFKKYFVISVFMINALIHEKQHKSMGFIYLLIPGREIKIIGT